MGMSIFGILFLVGLLLSMAASVTNVVQAFQESSTWGLLTLLVPFATFVFVAKFWQNKWIIRVFLLGMGGFILSLGSLVGLVAFLPEADRNLVFAEESLSDASWNGELQSYEAQANGDNGVFEPFAEGVRFATAAANQAQTAQTSREWDEVATNWDYAIAMMQSVPGSDPNFEVAQRKVEEYSKNFNYAKENAL